MFKLINFLTLAFLWNWKLEELHDFYSFLIPAIALPCFVTEFWLKDEKLKESPVWVHLLIGIVLSIFKYQKNEYISTDLLNAGVGINLLCLFGFTIIYEHFNTAISVLIFIMAHYGSLTRPPEHLYNYCLAGFVYSAYLSV